MLGWLRQEDLLAGIFREPPKGKNVFSVPDIMVVSVLALLLFGPDQLPKMMRQAGRIMREVQNTSHGFIAEMEKAADLQDRTPPPEPPTLADKNEPS